MTSTSVEQPLVDSLREAGLELGYTKGNRSHCWTWSVSSEQVCSLHVYRISAKYPWEVGYVETDLQWRRMGLARALYGYAVAQLGPIQHDVTRTREGDAWARAVGGVLPRLHLI